jgi:hypothetical protein
MSTRLALLKTTFCWGSTHLNKWKSGIGLFIWTESCHYAWIEIDSFRMNFLNQISKISIIESHQLRKRPMKINRLSINKDWKRVKITLQLHQKAFIWRSRSSPLAVLPNRRYPHFPSRKSLILELWRDFSLSLPKPTRQQNLQLNQNH